jgi:heme oxygenase
MSVRTYLKEASAPLHEAVDQSFSSYKLSDPAHYLNFLEVHAVALFQIEPMLEQAGVRRILPDWDERFRRKALQSDICALGGNQFDDQGLPVAFDDAMLWGAAYVLEGSRLGSRYLSRQVCGPEWDGEGVPLAYLTHGQDAALWPQFLRRLEEAAPTLDQAQLLKGVEWCFAMFLSAANHDVVASGVAISELHAQNAPS